MIKIKEPCKSCQCIDFCTKAVRNTIDNIPTGHGRDTYDCVHFADFERAFLKCVFQGIGNALRSYEGD